MRSTCVPRAFQNAGELSGHCQVPGREGIRLLGECQRFRLTGPVWHDKRPASIGKPKVLIEFQDLSLNGFPFAQSARRQEVPSEGGAEQKVERVFLQRALNLLLGLPSAVQRRKNRTRCRSSAPKVESARAPSPGEIAVRPRSSRNRSPRPSPEQRGPSGSDGSISRAFRASSTHQGGRFSRRDLFSVTSVKKHQPRSLWASANPGSIATTRSRHSLSPGR